MWPGQKFSLALDVSESPVRNRTEANREWLHRNLVAIVSRTRTLTPHSCLHTHNALTLLHFVSTYAPTIRLQEFSNKSILFQAQSEYQHVLVFRSAQYGNVLVLDGVIQLTERDEFSYHEIMTHVPLCSHPHPSRVLIVGGGDGGILREVCRHESVTEICVVEIDHVVVNVCRRFFGTSTAVCFDDPRVRLVHADAAEFLNGSNGSADSDSDNLNTRNSNEGYWDVIVGDTSDPVGPAESLFQPAFYESMYRALRPSGIVCVQAECFWIHLDLIADLTACCRDIFDSAEYCSTMVPTYPCGQIGFILASKQVSIRGPSTCRYPVRQPDFVQDLQWYSPAMHTAAFTLPPFVTRKIDEDYDSRMKRQDKEEEYKCFLGGGGGQCHIL
jgi:spermidine synthase